MQCSSFLFHILVSAISLSSDKFCSDKATSQVKVTYHFDHVYKIKRFKFIPLENLQSQYRRRSQPTKNNQPSQQNSKKNKYPQTIKLSPP